jgi:protein gp37
LPLYNGLAERDTNGDWRFNGTIHVNEKALEIPLHWKQPRFIFVCDMGDLFHENVSNETRDKVFAVSAQCQQHTFAFLTKRAGNMLEYFHDAPPFFLVNRLGPTKPLPNVWLGVTCENQQAADERIPLLLQTPAAVRFVSVEPMLEVLNIPPSLLGGTKGGVDWVICGGESGPNRRPFDVEWARDIRDQCKAAGVPFFMKQIDKLRHIPNDLMIREYPSPAAQGR